MILINKYNGEKIDLAEYDDIGYYCNPNEKIKRYIVYAVKDFCLPKEIKTFNTEHKAQAFCESIRRANKSGNIREYVYSMSDVAEAPTEVSPTAPKTVYKVKVRKVKPSASAVPRLKECGDGYDVYRRRFNAAMRKAYIKIMYR